MYGTKLLIFFACLSWTHCLLNKYCELCKDHTMCKYKGTGEKCEGGGESGVSEKDKSEILGVHNWLRGLVASGAEKKGLNGPQPKAANLKKLQWDDELAKVAQRWADQCHFSHDACRDDPRWKVGQNIYWKWQYPKHRPNWTEAIFSWYNEVSLYNPKGVDSYRFEPATGHYTQLLWHETSVIGCGRKDYGPNKLYVCNYGPAGNWVGEPLYEIGEPCSKCPEKFTCDSYLCAEQKLSQKTTKVPTLDSNFLRMLSEKITGNETSDVEALEPTEEDAEDIFANEKSKLRENQNQTQQNQAADSLFLRTLKELLKIEGSQKGTTNSIDDSGIELDSETKQEIEEVKQKIEGIVKTAIKKSKAKD